MCPCYLYLKLQYCTQREIFDHPCIFPFIFPKQYQHSLRSIESTPTNTMIIPVAISLQTNFGEAKAQMT